MDGWPFFGIISNLGVMFWSFSVAICLFSYVLLKKSPKPRAVANFIMLGGVLSFILLADDLFMLHEEIYPRLLGVDEKLVLLLYAALFFFYLVRFRQIILETNFIYLLLAIFFFFTSIIVDLLPPSFLPWHHLFEDGPKFLGIVSWFGYLFSVCSQETGTAIFTKAPDKIMNSL